MNKYIECLLSRQTLMLIIAGVIMILTVYLTLKSLR